MSVREYVIISQSFLIRHEEGMITQVDALEADLSAARKTAADKATEAAQLSKRLSDSLGRTAKLDDKVQNDSSVLSHTP